MSPSLPQLAAAVELVSGISQQLAERKNDAVAEIGSTFTELEKALGQRKGLLVRDLEALCGAKQKVNQDNLGDLLWAPGSPPCFLPQLEKAYG